MAKTRKKLYLAYSFDALENAPAIATFCSVPVEKITHGSLMMWRHVWRTQNDIVTTAHVRAFYGCDACEALVLFKQLEASEDGWRVKGAAEWLRVMGAQSDSGKEHAGNLKKGPKPSAPAFEPPAETPPAPLRLPPPKSTQAGENLPALTASSQQPAANKEKEEEEEAPPPPILIRPPIVEPNDKFGSAEAFWSWSQFKRSQVGLVAEKPPHPSKLSGWWSEVHLELNGDPTRLEAAFYKFAESKHWESRDPPLPFHGFISTWRDFAPAKRRA